MSNAAYGSDGARPKSVYEPVAKLEAFYTGGAVRVTRDNQHMACACGDEVKVMDLATGTVTRTLPGVRRKPVYALEILQQQQLQPCMCGCLSACLCLCHAAGMPHQQLLEAAAAVHVWLAV